MLSQQRHPWQDRPDLSPKAVGTAIVGAATNKNRNLRLEIWLQSLDFFASGVQCLHRAVKSLMHSHHRCKCKVYICQKPKTGIIVDVTNWTALDACARFISFLEPQVATFFRTHNNHRSRTLLVHNARQGHIKLPEGCLIPFANSWQRASSREYLGFWLRCS